MTAGTRRILGRTDLAISPVGLGTWALGGDWGPASDRDSIAAIHRAVGLGVNWIDTAPGYGPEHAEVVVGRALKGLEHPPLLFTKAGFVRSEDGSGLTPMLKSGSVREQLEGSLMRLGVEAIDLYQIHWREPDEDIEEAWGTLAELKAEGKVRHIGVSNFDVEQLQRCEAIAPVETLQPPYSMLVRTPLWEAPFVGNAPRESIEAEILPYCERLDIGVIIYSPLASGLLGGRMTRERLAALPGDDWRRGEADFNEPLVGRTLSLVERLRPIARARDCSLAELAIAWALAHPAVHDAVVGMRTPEQVDSLIAAAACELGPEDLEPINELIATA